ncbi:MULTISPECIES: NUDIX hydrolase [unclassified Gordonia (in: high G+C Gram-positive bacteria)]|uniref:NUDIX hydrolase n=1 Tax=unclassified Gordonia (in: high G+C Gram-positive bacteria) TaxID=2657482 RepID=UPI0020001D23|nr:MULTISPECIES: NUDIX domain-containing protein [unclassified Gordonia (in: high G+C Gram-positive bacteria)]UQE73991.1 NUDIX domain-containing protein [Gordonia sp. PP30]
MSDEATNRQPEASPRDASTVVLVRDGDGAIEVFLQHRVRQMAFAGGMTVFPGGGVDPRDREAEIGWIGPDLRWWAHQLGTEEESARALVSAAVRETFEECGVLLAGTADAVVPDPAVYAGERDRLVAKEISFAQFLIENDLCVRTDLLAPLAHWITPRNEKRRYDTRFFLAALPEGQNADGATSEAEATEWATAEAALADWQSGRRFLLPPTWTQLREIARHESVADLIAEPRVITAIEPAVPSDGGVMGLGFADSADYFAVLNDGRLTQLEQIIR